MVFKKGQKAWNRLKLDEQVIVDLYSKKKLSSYKISDMFNCSPQAIIRILRENNIIVKTRGHPSWCKGLTKETDERVKLISKLNKGKKLSKEHKEKLSEIRKRLHREGKLECPTKLMLDTNLIKDLYINKRKSLKEISMIIGCSSPTIKTRLIGQGIKIRNTREYLIGKKRKIFSDETKRKMGIASREKWKNLQYREKQRKANLGKKHPWTTKRNLEDNPTKDPQVRKKISEKLIKRLKEGKYNLKPNKPEKIMIELINKFNLPFRYVGDGKMWIRGKGTAFNPDFLSDDLGVIIEVFGDYWHNLSHIKIRDIERLEAYSNYGFETIIIWESELKNPIQVVNKVLEIVNKIQVQTIIEGKSER